MHVLVTKPEGKRPLTRPRRKWEDNIKTNLRKIGWEVIYCIHLVQDKDYLQALVNTVMNIRVP
jgi:hypothetical protein